MFTSLRSAITTTMAMIVIHAMNNQRFANAQELYIACQDGVNDAGTPYEICFLNAASPLTFTLGSGNSVSFGSESYIAVTCIPGVSRSIDSCLCSVVVDPSTPFLSTDICNSCSIQVVSDIDFLAYFDCSNRLVGDCVGFDDDGLCIDNNVGTAPVRAPVRIPTSAPLGTIIQPQTPRPALATTPAPRTTPTTPRPFTVTTPAPRPPPTPFPVLVVTTLTPLPPPTLFPVIAATLAPQKLPTAIPIIATTGAPRLPPTSLPITAPLSSPVRSTTAGAPTSSINQPANGTFPGEVRGSSSSAMVDTMFVNIVLFSVGLVMMMNSLIG